MIGSSREQMVWQQNIRLKERSLRDETLKDLEQQFENQFVVFDDLTDKQKISITQLSNKAYLYQFPYWSIKDNCRLMVYTDGEEVIAYSVITIKKIPFTGKEVFRITYGPVFSEPACLLAHLKLMTESLPAKCLALEINPYCTDTQTNTDIIEIIQRLGFTPGSTNTSTYKTTLQLDLDRPMEEIRGSFRRSLKTQLNRAIKSGVDVERTDQDEQWEEAIAHYNDFAETNPIHFISKEEASIIRQFKNERFHLFKASMNGDFLGCLILYSLDDHVLADWLVVTEQAKEQKLPVTHCLHWEAINWAKSAGFANYDFAGFWQDLGSDNSINRFKLGFTKQEVPLCDNYTFTKKPKLLERVKKIHELKMSLAQGVFRSKS